METKDRIVKTTEENCHNTLEERLVEQDGISFKAGYDKRDSEFVYNPDYLDFQKGVKTGKELGIRELAKWRLEPCPHRSHNAKYFKPKCACEKCWQAKLKELEADNEL